MTTRKRKTAWSWGAIQAAIEMHLVRHSAIYGYVCTAAAAIAMVTCTGLPAHATMQPALKGAGASNTISTAVAAPTDKRGFVMSESQAGRGASAASRHGYGQDEPTRKGGCTAVDVLLTSCPPYARSKAAGGFYVPTGA